MTNKLKSIQASITLIALYRLEERANACPYCVEFRYKGRGKLCGVCPQAAKKNLGCINTYVMNDLDWMFYRRNNRIRGWSQPELSKLCVQRIKYHYHLIKEFKQLPDRAFTRERTNSDLKQLQRIISYKGD